MELKLLEPTGEIKVLGDSLKLDKGEVIKRNLLIILPKEEITSSNTHIMIGIYKGGEEIEKISSSS